MMHFGQFMHDQEGGRIRSADFSSAISGPSFTLYRFYGPSSFCWFSFLTSILLGVEPDKKKEEEQNLQFHISTRYNSPIATPLTLNPSKKMNKEQGPKQRWLLTALCPSFSRTILQIKTLSFDFVKGPEETRAHNATGNRNTYAPTDEFIMVIDLGLYLWREDGLSCR
jgi:hypothetical protein